jgi:hypothetical protein
MKKANNIPNQFGGEQMQRVVELDIPTGGY